MSFGDTAELSRVHAHACVESTAPGGSRMRRTATSSRVLVLCLMLVLSACAVPGAAAMTSAHTAATRVTATPTATPKPFDPGVGAPLPDNRIVAAYGIVGGVDYNGPASTLDMLDGFLPQLQDLGKQYAKLDPTHPVLLGVDLVVNVIQPCGDFPKWCASFTDDPTIQQYVDYCKQHNLLLFFDLQLGTEPVSDAITSHLLPYLEKYSFVELALDTEFHFPNTPQGYADAEGYPCCLGWMQADEVNWTINELANISMQYHLPRKVLVIHEWNSGVLPDKGNIKLNPNVSVVLQSDGFGTVDEKLGDYQVFVQQQLIQYGGYKLFLPYADHGALDYPLMSPQDVLNLFPQPIFISYQ
jgi:hypothetical protein